MSDRETHRNAESTGQPPTPSSAGSGAASAPSGSARTGAIGSGAYSLGVNSPGPNGAGSPWFVLLLTLLGLGLLGVHVGWRDDGVGGFGLGWGAWWGAPRWLATWAPGDVGFEGIAAGRSLRPWLLPLAAVLGAGCGWQLSSLAGLSRGARRWTVLGAALAVIGACDPGLLSFLLERRAETAPGYRELQHLLRALGATLLAAAVWNSGRCRAREDREAWIERVPTIPLLGLLGSFALLLNLGLSEWVLGGEPLTNDGQAYRWQAGLFAAGEVKLAGGAWSDFFPGRQLYSGEFVYSKYPPGHSLALALGERLGWMPLLPSLGVALAPALAFGIARLLRSRGAKLAALLFAFSPAWVALGCLELSHGTSVPAALVFLLATLAGLRAGEQGRAGVAGGWAGISGLALGVVLLTRPGTAVSLSVPLIWALASLLRQTGTGGIRSAGAILLGGLIGLAPTIVAFAWINAQTTGDPWLPAYVQYAREVSPNDRWGWVNREHALNHTLLTLGRQQAWLLGLAPGLVLACLGWAAGGQRRGLVLGWCLAPAGFYALLRFHGVPWAGPLYWSEVAVLPLIACAQGWRVLSRPRGDARRAGDGILALPAGIGALALLIGSGVPAAREAAHRAAPREVAAQLEAAAELGPVGVLFVPLENERDRRRFHLAPPLELATGAAPAGWWLARDLGPRNSELLRALGDLPALRYDSRIGRAEPLPGTGSAGD